MKDADATKVTWVAKRAQRLAEEIEQDIIARNLPVGQSLGTEPEMLETYGVSRSILREALVLACRSGLVTVRRGKSGGAFVSAPTQDGVAIGLTSYLDFVMGDVSALWPVRRALEDLALRLAADRLDPARIDAIAALQTKFRNPTDGRARLGMASDMLREIAYASGNPILATFVICLSRLSVGRLVRSARRERSLLDSAEDIAKLRNEQLSAVLAADLGRALSASAKIYDMFSIMSAEAADPAEPPAEDQAVEDVLSADAGGDKLANKVAYAIKERIIREHLEEGSRLGSEAELMTELGVSRGVLRAAIRILERMSVVRMMRGIHGGLRVIRPDASAVTDSSSRYLLSLNVRFLHIQELVEVLSLCAIESAAVHRAPAPEALSGLTAYIGRSVRDLTAAHHAILGSICQNAVIAVLMNIMSRLTEMDESPDADLIQVTDLSAASLERVIAAVRDGDSDMARRHMLSFRRNGGVRVRKITPFSRPAKAAADPVMG